MYIGVNGYPDGAVRCWCHWLKFGNTNLCNRYHKEKIQ